MPGNGSLGEASVPAEQQSVRIVEYYSICAKLKKASSLMIQAHLGNVALDKTNVVATYSDQYGDYEVKESLFAGPSGEFANFESTWEVTPDGGYRLTTVIPYGRGKDK
jgi:hypothetical protein